MNIGIECTSIVLKSTLSECLCLYNIYNKCYFFIFCNCSSSRSIKRRKFDDELVESSLNVSSTTGFGPKVARTRTPSMSANSSTVGMLYFINKFSKCIYGNAVQI